MAAHDIVVRGRGLWEAGADGIDFDTSGAAGDADLLATLRAAREIRDRCPDIGIEIGHGERDRARHARRARVRGRAARRPLAARAAEAVPKRPAPRSSGRPSTSTPTKSLAWNLARALHAVQAGCEEATIPVHMNVGMGVGGVPMAVRAAGRRGLAGRPGLRRHPEGGRLVGGRGRSARDGVDTRARLGHGRDAGRRRSGGPHADDPGHAAPAGEALRRRQAGRRRVGPVGRRRRCTR